jgi:hypothetical protein
VVVVVLLPPTVRAEVMATIIHLLAAGVGTVVVVLLCSVVGVGAVVVIEAAPSQASSTGSRS